MITILLETLWGKHITDAGFTKSRASLRAFFSSFMLGSVLFFISFALMALDEVSAKSNLNVIVNFRYLLKIIWVPLASFGVPFLLIAFMASVEMNQEEWRISFRTLSRWESWYNFIFCTLTAAWTTILFSAFSDKNNFAAVRSDILVHDHLLGALMLGCLAIFWAISSSIDREYNNRFSRLHAILVQERSVTFWTNYPESYLEDRYLNFFELCLRYSMHMVPEFNTTFNIIGSALKQLSMPASHARYALAWWPAAFSYLYPPDKTERAEVKHILPGEFPLETAREFYDKYIGSALKSRSVEKVRSRNSSSRLRRQPNVRKVG